jgi:alkanesulfonate monooxygenase SsuD/methylene tetrahydromethanopterin reductase-like flavin-dependent oxidoreductase (luciferase family)
MPESLPAISLVAVPGRRRQTLDIARAIERRGFAGVYVPSRYGNMAQCAALALAGRIAEGVLFANVSLSHVAGSLAAVPPARRNDREFLVGNMLPVCINQLTALDDIFTAFAR